MTLLAYRVLAIALLFVGLYFGYITWRDIQRDIGEQRATTRYNVAIDKQKLDARAALNTALAERDRNAVKLAELRTTLEQERETTQAKNAAALRDRRAGARLQFVAEDAGCRRGSDPAKGAPPGTADNASPAVVQLPEPINGNLLDFAADAQSLAIDYKVLHTYVNNPKLVCELQQ